MSGRLLMIGLIAFAVIFGAALWWFQTRGHYERVTGLSEVMIAGAAVAVSDYEGIDGGSSPLKLRGCFTAGEFAAPPADAPEPLTAPDWFACFDAETLSTDIASGAAAAFAAERHAPFGFDRIVARYPDGRAFQWRQINACGTAHFAGDPLPADCPKPSE